MRRRNGRISPRRERRDLLAAEAGSSPRSARSGAARACRPSTCRSPIRRRGRASRRGGSQKLTPSTAFTCATVRRRNPRCTGKCFLRSSTSRTGDLDGATPLPFGRGVRRVREAAVVTLRQHSLAPSPPRRNGRRRRGRRRPRAAAAPRRGSARPRRGSAARRRSPRSARASDGTMPGISARRRLRARPPP